MSAKPVWVMLLLVAAGARAQTSLTRFADVGSSGRDKGSLQETAIAPPDVGVRYSTLDACSPCLDPARPLTLNDAVDLALGNGTEVRQSWAAIKLQTGVLGEARAAYLPTLNASVSRLHTDTNYPEYSVDNTYQTGNTAAVNLSMRIFDFGARGANKRAAELALAAAVAGHDASLQKAASSVISAYFDAVTAKAVMSTSRASTKLAQETLDSARRREESGAIAVGDTLQATAALARARLAAQRAVGDYRKALSLLLYTMGLQPETSIELADLPSSAAIDLRLDLDEWLREARQQHPAILAARAQWEADLAKTDEARSDGLPTLDFTGSWYRNGYPNQGLQTTGSSSATVGFTLTIPLSDGFIRRHKVQEAEARAEQDEAQLHDTEHHVLMDILKAHAEAQAAVENLAASELLQAAALAAEESMRRRYDAGAADILALVAAEQALADAEQERVRCLAEWQSARLRLMANAGVFGSNMLTATRSGG